MKLRFFTRYFRRFYLRDVLWLILFVTLILLWRADHQRLEAKVEWWEQWAINALRESAKP